MNINTRLGFKPTILVRSLVTCSVFGDGLYKVIDKRGIGYNEELRLVKVGESNKTAQWVYAARCTYDLKANRQVRQDTVDKIAKAFGEQNKIESPIILKEK